MKMNRLVRKQFRLLLLEDEPADAELVCYTLRKAGLTLEMRCVDSREGFITALRQFVPDVILADYDLPDFNGRQALDLSTQECPLVPVLIVTGSMNEKTAVACMKAGAADYLIKDNLRRLGPAVVAALKNKRVREQKQVAERTMVESEKRYRSLFHDSPISLWELDASAVKKNLEMDSRPGSDTGNLGQDEVCFPISCLNGMKCLAANRVSRNMLFGSVGQQSAEDIMNYLRNRNVRLLREIVKRLIAGEEQARWETQIRSSLGETRNVMIRYSLVSGSVDTWSRILVSLVDITERIRLEEERKDHIQAMIRAMHDTIQAMAVTVEKRDPYTAGHQRRVASLACAIAQELGLDREQKNGIQMAAIVHDIGKMFIPSEILSKPGRLSELEFSMIQTHPQAGYDILKMVRFPWPVADIVLQHHERIDGSGYPNGISGRNIALEARVIAVADVVEAMASHRPYRPALGINSALQEISDRSGEQYDAGVVDACVQLFQREQFSINTVSSLSLAVS